MEKDLGKSNLMFSGAFDDVIKIHNHPIPPHKCIQTITTFKL